MSKPFSFFQEAQELESRLAAAQAATKEANQRNKELAKAAAAARAAKRAAKAAKRRAEKAAKERTEDPKVNSSLMNAWEVLTHATNPSTCLSGESGRHSARLRERQ